MGGRRGVVFGSTVVVAAGVALFALLVPDKHSVVGLDSEAPLSWRLYWSLREGVRWDDISPLATLSCLAAFALALAAAAVLRAYRGAKPSAPLMMVLCATPFLASLALAPFALWDHDSGRADWSVFVVLELRRLGASLSLGLLCAEALNLARLGGPGVRPRRMAVSAFLLALPFQFGWYQVTVVRGGWALWVVALAAAITIPLSLRHGGARTGQVIVALTLGLVMGNAVVAGLSASAAISYYGCGPATRLGISTWDARDFYPLFALETFPWVPGIVSLALLALLRRPRGIVAGLAAGGLIVAADGAAIAQLSEIQAPHQLRPTADFEPLGRGEAGSSSLRLGEKVLLDPNDEVLLREPFAAQNLEELGAVLGRFAFPQPVGATGDTTLLVVAIAVDPRLSPERLATLFRVARERRIQALGLARGEDLEAPGLVITPRTHVRRTLALGGGGLLLLERPPEPKGSAKLRDFLRARPFKPGPEGTVVKMYEAVESGGWWVPGFVDDPP